MTSLREVWPAIPSPQPVTEPVRRISAELLAEAAAAKARLHNAARQDDRDEEEFTEGRTQRPFPVNPHE